MALRGVHGAGGLGCFISVDGELGDSTIDAGDFFLGIFLSGGNIRLLDSLGPLQIEALAFDRKTGEYNFYEKLTGEDWAFRGDSSDILNQVSKANLGDPIVLSGTTPRCTGCHTLGGPILKELDPWTSWKTEQSSGLTAGATLQNSDDLVRTLVARAEGAEHLDKAVLSGLRKYVNSMAAKGLENEQQWLRSVLHPLEMNLVSDAKPYDSRSPEDHIELPAAFFVDPRLSGPAPPILVKKKVYAQALAKLGSTYDAGRAEGQFAFLVPVRSRHDELRIDNLLERGKLDQETLADLLAVDYSTPLFSPDREFLITKVPKTYRGAAELKAQLISTVADDGHASRELRRNLTDPTRDVHFHKAQALALLEKVRRNANSTDAVAGWLVLAAQRRQEITSTIDAVGTVVRRSTVSKIDTETKFGESFILENGDPSDVAKSQFRHGFPALKAQSPWPPKPYRLRLDPVTGLKALRI
ncbi:MAG: hypothetical protein AB7S38_14680 [Vulcanimicrobiota bacterium]